MKFIRQKRQMHIKDFFLTMKNASMFMLPYEYLSDQMYKNIKGYGY